MSMTIPTVPSLAAGQVVQLADLVNLAAAAQFALNRPMAKIRDTAGGQAITTSFAAVTFSTADFDPDGMWSVSHPTRLTVQTPGWYKVRYGINVGSVGGTFTSRVNSTTGSNNPVGSGVVSAPFWAGATDLTAATVGWATGGGDWPFYLFQGDYIEVLISAAAAGASTGIGTPGTGPTTSGSYFSMELVSI